MEVTSLFWLMYPLMYPLVIENCNWTSTINGALWRLITGGYVQTSKNIFHTQVSENTRTPKSSIYIWCSIINHPFWGLGIHHLWKLFFVQIFSIYSQFLQHRQSCASRASSTFDLSNGQTIPRNRFQGQAPRLSKMEEPWGVDSLNFLRIFVFRVCRVDLSI